MLCPLGLYADARFDVTDWRRPSRATTYLFTLLTLPQTPYPATPLTAGDRVFPTLTESSFEKFRSDKKVSWTKLAGALSAFPTVLHTAK